MEKSVLYISILIAIMTGFILFSFIISILRYHRRYGKLQKERLHAEINMQESERKRIANDLHDSLGPLLSSVKLQINSIEPKETEDQEIISKAGKHIDTLAASLREISYDLLPHSLERKGLVEAIRQFVTGLDGKKIPMKITMNAAPQLKISPENGIHIYRVVQEIINNSLKHSQGKNIDIHMEEQKGDLLILIEDDGIGFDRNAEYNGPGGMGLKSMESRIDVLKGKLNFESEKGKGTRYFLSIPNR